MLVLWWLAGSLLYLGNGTTITDTFLNKNLTIVSYNIAMSIKGHVWGMKMIVNCRRHRYLARGGIFLVVVALTAGMVGCGLLPYPIPGPIPPIPDPGPSVDLEIRTWHDLDAVRDNLAGNHRLMNSLNATTPGYDELAGPTADDGRGWYPLGDWDPYDHHLYLAFTGTFDGQGYEIADLFIDRPGAGLFRYVSEGAVIQNVALTNATVTGGHYVGGLVALLSGTVNNCYSSGNVTGEWAVGGLVGANHGGTVSKCYSTSSVTGDRPGGFHIDEVGGLVGRNRRGTIENSYATGIVTGNRYIGGLVGDDDGGTIRNCYFSGSLAGTYAVGGLVGGGYHRTSDRWFTVSNSFWDLQVSGIEESDGGTAKTTTEMMSTATFTDTATEGLVEPWDLVAVAPGDTNSDHIWNIVDGKTYPFLSWQSVP